MDSDNILSILTSLGQGQPDPNAPPTNVLQAMAPAVNAPPQAAPSPVVAAATAASPPIPKPRRSLLDTVGRIADVFAQVGGATPLYQPTLDAREKHGFDVQDHGLTVDSATIKNATDKFALGKSQNERLGQAARGLQAIQKAGGDINKAWPVLAQQMQFDAPTTASIGQRIASDPNALVGIIAASADPKDDQARYGGQPVIATGPDGKLHAFQASLHGDDARDILPPGYTPVDPLQFVNTGDKQVAFGKNSGAPKTAISINASPDTVMTTGEKADEFHYTAQQKAQEEADKKTADHLQKFNVFDTAVSTLSGLDAGLNDLIKDPSLSEATGLVNGKLNLTDGQRTIDAKIENLVNQSIGPAIAVIKQSGGAAPRAVSEIMGEAQALLGAVKNRTAPTAAYVANVQAASRRLHQRIQLAENAALREGYAIRGPNGFEPAPAVNSVPTREKPSPATSGNKPNAIVNVSSPEEAAKLPKGTRFRTHDGRILVRK